MVAVVREPLYRLCRSQHVSRKPLRSTCNSILWVGDLDMLRTISVSGPTRCFSGSARLHLLSVAPGAVELSDGLVHVVCVAMVKAAAEPEPGVSG